MSRRYRQEDSKVEVRGFEARHYDTLMNLITFGWYPKFIRQAIADLGLQPGEKVLDFGAGTGRNALLMREYVGENGTITALEIGEEMKAQFTKKTATFRNIGLVDRRIDEPLPYESEYDVVFISFVLHGFVQEKRDIIIQNAYQALKPGGRFAILDYSNFDVDRAVWYVRWAIRKAECPLAEDFIDRDTKAMLKPFGFERFEEHFYFKNYLRLLKAYKPIKI
ncbi:class I SAM-dependent methyltransferase [Hydrogenimonas urashimensis]|uniref:class I SAM-dependent methyltransferase n=1 Tax=Hydrogenimonas urashimensis TaxID=2740515 RepID=UPI001915A075|nr:methyltransferase domain-containing protein [Hydrogenimonas urashimensis]